MKCFLLPWIALAGLAVAHPLDPNLNATWQHGYEHAESYQLQRRASPGDFYLRILPLGASIVWGLTSVDYNGFRKHLRDQLRWSGWDVNMVGTLNNGGMSDNNVEATPGFVIDQINGLAQEAYQYLPNLVIINAGTNDCNQNLDIPNAHIRLGNMLDGLFNAIPDTTIIVSTLLPNGNAALAANAVIYNANLRAMLATRIAAGQKIVTAEMETGFITIDDIGTDGTHPTTEGYSLMASVFWYAIQAALAQDMITAPANNGYDDAAASSKPVCLKTLGDTLTELETQVGSGTDDGIYVHKSADMGIVYTILAEARNAKNDFWFANILGSGRDDIVQFRSTDDGTASFVIHQNLGGGSFSAVTGFMDVGWFCNAVGVRWGDFNGDGLDDFVCVGPDGGISLAINNGGAGLPTFTVVGLIMAAQEGLQASVRLGDIDGDGRCDYCVVHANGDLHCWRNGGDGLAPTSAYENGIWQDLGLVWTGGNGGDVNGVMLVDINGDHRSDWLSMDTTGAVHTSTNSRFCNVDPDNFLLDWQDAGNTHAGLATAGVRDYIKFGRVYGDTGYRSYIHVTNTSLVDNAYQYSFQVFLNEGAGGTRRKADGNHYCDMRGTGADDYIWVDVNGALTIFGNEHSYPNWVHYGEVYTVPNVYDRRSIHFADMNGNGRCDILHVNTVTGATEVFQNNYNAVTDTFSFTYLGFQSGSISCTQGMGVGLRDLGVRFADIDGNGMADYLCIEPDGRTTGWLNMGGNSWVDVGQVKVSVGYDRANHRFVDVNGDGRADFLWINKFTGEVQVWLNEGQTPAIGSSFTWTDQGFRYAGHAQGHCMHYPNIGGLGLADMHYAHSTVNNAETWFNTCGGTASYSTNGDDGTIANPSLKVFTVASSYDSSTGVFEESGSSGTSCIGGTGPDSPVGLKALCATTCMYNDCPSPCLCTAFGTLVIAPNGDGSSGTGVDGSTAVIDSLCALACPQGVCPTTICVHTTGSSGSSGSSSGSGDFPTPNPFCTNGNPPPGYGAWPCVSCTDASVSDSVDPIDRWTAADSDECLTFLVDWYTESAHGGGLYPEYGANNAVSQWAAYLNVTPFGTEPGNRACFLTSSATSCDTLNICDADVPAGSLIFDSFSNLKNLFNAYYDALTGAEALVATDITKLTSTFASVEVDDDTTFDLVLSLITLGYGQLSAGIWNKVLKDTKFFTATASAKNDHGWFKDSTNNMVTTALGIAKNAGQAAEIKIDQAGELSSDLGGIFVQFQTFIETQLNNMFAGTTDGLSDLETMLTGGVFVEEIGLSLNFTTLQPILDQVLLSMLIPRAWALSTDVDPVILVQPGANNQTNPFTHVYNGARTGPYSKAGANNWGLSDDEADALRVTVGDYTLYMFSVHPYMSQLSSSAALLNGAKELTAGNTEWQGLTYSDMVVSSFQGYQVNGNQNGYSLDSADAEATLFTDGDKTLGDFAFQNYFATPGYYTFPVCSVEEIVYNAFYLVNVPDGCEYFPCCGITAEQALAVDEGTLIGAD